MSTPQLHPSLRRNSLLSPSNNQDITCYSERTVELELQREMTIPRLPPELHDYIIDFAHANRDVLAALGLVCRSWLASSRYHLFGTLKITNYTAGTFFELVESRRNTLLTFVRSLTLSEQGFKLSGGGLPHPAFWATALPRLPRLLRASVTRLEIGSRLVFRLYRLTTTSSLFPNLTNFYLNHIRFDSVSHLFRLLSSLDKLERLQLLVSFLEDDPRPVTYVSPSQLRYLDLDVQAAGSRNRSCSLQILEWILTGSPVPVIRDLCLRNTPPEDLQLLESFPPKLGKHLQSFVLHFYVSNYRTGYQVGPQANAHAMYNVNLFHNQNLRSITLSGIIWTDIVNVFPLPYRLLQSIKQPLWHLEFNVDVATMARSSIADFDGPGSKILQVLAMPQFSQLKTLEFRLRCYTPMPNPAPVIATWLSESLGEFEKKGVLRATVVYR